MKISIITATYNSEKTIRDTIESIISQNYLDLEYIVIDGKSTDNTINIVNSYTSRLNIKIVSEEDSGLYNAMNKGVSMATGDIVGILNSDDFYAQNNVLEKVSNAFKNPEIDAVYGDLIYVDKNNTSKETRLWEAGEFSEKKLNSGWIIPHPTLFLRKNVYDNCEKIFDESLKIAADYEFTLRLLKIKKIKTHYIPEVLVKMREGGTSGKNISHRIQGWKELKNSWKINNLKAPSFFILRRIFSKINQLFS